MIFFVGSRDAASGKQSDKKNYTNCPHILFEWIIVRFGSQDKIRPVIVSQSDSPKLNRHLANEGFNPRLRLCFFLVGRGLGCGWALFLFLGWLFGGCRSRRPVRPARVHVCVAAGDHKSEVGNENSKRIEKSRSVQKGFSAQQEACFPDLWLRADRSLSDVTVIGLSSATYFQKFLFHRRRKRKEKISGPPPFPFQIFFSAENREQ